QIFHSAGDIREYDEDQLLVGEQDSPEPESSGALFENSLGRDDFYACLTANRLKHPLTDNLYALHAARIQFIPFQFKPLVKLLRSDMPRILIADEVGVGKTIEAGLILKELQARQNLTNVLILCPKSLVTKWQAEMRRFDEEFQILSSESLRYCLRQTDIEGEWPSKYARSIVHLELFRKPDYLFGKKGRHAHRGLVELNPLPQFDLLILDEAHHVRNSGTNSHQLAKKLCEASGATLLLSATPIQLGSQNLFTLLNLLRPDLFQDEVTFQEMVVPNRSLTQAVRHIRSRKPDDDWQVEALNQLKSAAQTTWGSHTLACDAGFLETLKMLEKTTPVSDAERITCLRNLEELHTLAHIMNRTRRRDIGRFTLREPNTVTVPFTPEQQIFYTELLAFRRAVLALDYDPIVIRLILDMLERQTASCLPALLPMLNQFLRTGRFLPATLSDDIDDENELDLPEELIDKARKLKELAIQIPDQDPKWEALLELTRTTNRSEGPGKLLVFSFFLHTLEYLAQKFRVAGFRVGTITGKVTEEDRQRLRDCFRKPRHETEAIDVLLSSEVGCEGLDYEFCDRLVNYDIPWNPMRLEQRIGRIDRFGQQAEKVLIFNFVTPDTVEDRIFFRCYERLGIFKDTIGDCEEVLGQLQVFEELLSLARNPKLSPTQAEEKARQIADNALRLLEEQRRLEAEGSDLFSLDQAMTTEIETLEATGRFVSPNDLHAMLTYFLAQAEFGGAFEKDRENPRIFRLRLNREARANLSARLRVLKYSDRSVQTFRKWLDGNDPYLLVTFDQKIALNRRDIPFITPVHPLTRLAIDSLSSVGKNLTVRLHVQTTDLPTGIYVFSCDMWEMIAVRPETRLVVTAWDVERQQLASEVSQRLFQLIPAMDPGVPHSNEREEQCKLALEQLSEAAYHARQHALEELRVYNKVLLQRRLASLETYYQRQ
ncbi:MAG TPA: SNF2-related protein, partial [Acidobacteriota bacterium]|nr:SNF2-related protein [Acidobacteriota bacterium]